jgi:hypothetical protein
MAESNPIKITLIYLEGGLRCESKGDNTKKLTATRKSPWLTLPGLKGESEVTIHAPSVRMFEVVEGVIREQPGVGPQAADFKPVHLQP